MRIIHFLEDPYICAFVVMVEQNLVYSQLCSFLLRPVECSCEMTNGMVGHLDLRSGIEQVVRPMFLALLSKKLKATRVLPPEHI